MSEAISGDIILSLNAEAQSKQSQGFEIINGTVGMMYLDSGELPVPDIVRDVLAKHNRDEDLCYSGISGTPSFCDNLIKWFFDNSFAKAKSCGLLKALATIGGTGACALAFYDSCLADSSVLLFPKLAWPNYVTISKIRGTVFEFYDNFFNGGFDFPGVEKQLTRLVGMGKKPVLVINDPCQNPTGYSMTPNEWEELVNLFERIGVADRVSLIYDCAYIDFAPESAKGVIADSLLKISRYADVYVCMSFSKTFSFYGIRIGGLAVLTNDSVRTSEVYRRVSLNARAFWSTPNHMAVNTISDLLSNEDSFSSLKNVVSKNREILLKRATVFMDEAKKCHLPVFPYSAGFFVSIACKDAIKTVNRLKEKNVFVVPVAVDVIRVALSCIPTKHIYGLARTIMLAL